MTKIDFLDKLRAALNGSVSDSLLKENMTYYNEYIDSQIAMGQTEQEVMDMLGDPRLIARTIIQTNGSNGETTEDTYYSEREMHEDNTSYDRGSYSDGSYNQGGNYSGQNEVRVRTIPGWLLTVIVILIVVCVVSFVFRVLFPFILPILIVLFFVKLFRDWLN